MAEINNLQSIKKPAVERRCCNHSWLWLCSTLWAASRSGGTDPGCVPAVSSAAMEQWQEGTRNPAGPSSASLYLVASLLISDMHTFLFSYLIIFIIKITLISPAHREEKKDSDSENIMGGSALPPRCFCQSFGHLPKETGSVSTYLHWCFEQGWMAKWLWPLLRRYRTGRGRAAPAFLGVHIAQFVPSKTRGLHPLPQLRLLD